ncbi:DNA-binding response regulator [Streptomyces sp. NPDC002795]|uniref:response regulator transcription factor n=1 Tax=Streptomyces sp. NPDC002795 TaxID=3364665 RepID=UPI003687D18E
MTSAVEINLLIRSDDPVALAGIRAIVDEDASMTLICHPGDSTDGRRCQPSTTARPHVIILGEPPSKRFICENVQATLSTYGHATSRPKTLVVSRNDDDDVIVAALRVGVNGYISRIGSPEELLHSIRIVAQGGAVFSRTIAARFSRYFSTMPSIPELTGFADLTARELEILELLADGLRNQQIARRLFLAEKTVRNYVTRIFAKLEVHDRASAAIRARDAGFGGQPELLLGQGA